LDVPVELADTQLVLTDADESPESSVETIDVFDV
jgi:hypothetical protein